MKIGRGEYFCPVSDAYFRLGYVKVRNNPKGLGWRPEGIEHVLKIGENTPSPIFSKIWGGGCLPIDLQECSVVSCFSQIIVLAYYFTVYVVVDFLTLNKKGND